MKKCRYLQVKDSIVDEWIKIDLRARTIINKRDFPYLYTPFGTSENLEQVREFQRRLRKHRKDIETTLWFGNVEAILREQAAGKRSGDHSMALPKGSRSHDHTQHSDNPKITRYELSNDRVGLVAYLAGGTSYHIHSNELTPEQILIKIQLLGMEGG